jgi:hypothetical protein
MSNGLRATSMWRIKHHRIISLTGVMLTSFFSRLITRAVIAETVIYGRKETDSSRGKGLIPM